MDDQHECDCPPPGAPAWMGTFADLMSLLMCFFVLLLAFSEMDVLKYKQVAGSMAEAFGVQNQIKKKDIPRGTSIIAQEFSPGRPDPTPLNVVQQKTTDVTNSTLDVFCEEGKDEKSNDGSNASTVMVIDKLKEMIEQTESDAVSIATEMEQEIRSGQIEVETKEREIVIRVRENGSFASGSDRLKANFIPIMARIREVLVEVPGNISVEGHSDSMPIRTARFRSNWDLSAARAVSVAHELMVDSMLDKQRIRVSGFADSRPLVEENSPESRARNRRVEIVISQEELTKPEKEMLSDGSLQDLPIIESKEDPQSQALTEESLFQEIVEDNEVFEQDEPHSESREAESTMESRIETQLELIDTAEDELF